MAISPSPASPTTTLNARDRLRDCGPEALSDGEVLAALFGAKASTVASDLLTSYGDLPTLSRARLDELARRLGKRRASALAAALELGRRAQLPRLARPLIRSHHDAERLCAPLMRHLAHEQFRALFLDIRHRLVRNVVIVEGGLTTCSVMPREIFAPALACNAIAAILVHNHPSGDPTPSADDIALTTRLRQAGAVLGVKVLDHIVIGEASSISMHDQGHFSRA